MGGDTADDLAISPSPPPPTESGGPGTSPDVQEKDRESSPQDVIDDSTAKSTHENSPTISPADRPSSLEESKQEGDASGKEVDDPERGSQPKEESEKREAVEEVDEPQQQEDHPPAPATAPVTPAEREDDANAKQETAGPSSGAHSAGHSKQNSRSSLQGPHKHQPHPKLHGRKPGKSGGVSSPAASATTGPQQHQHQLPTLQRRVSQSRLSQRTCRILLDRHRDKIISLLAKGTTEGKKLLERLVATALCSTLRSQEDVSPTISPRGTGSVAGSAAAAAGGGVRAQGGGGGSSSSHTNPSAKASTRKTKASGAEAGERQYALMKRFLRNHGSPLVTAVFTNLLKEKKDFPAGENEEEAVQIFASCVCDGLGASPPSRVRGLAELIAKTIRVLCEESQFQEGANEGSSLEHEGGDSSQEKKAGRGDQSTSSDANNPKQEGAAKGPQTEVAASEGHVPCHSSKEFKSVKEILEQHKKKDMLRRQSSNFSRISPEAATAGAHSTTPSRAKEAGGAAKAGKDDCGEKEKDVVQLNAQAEGLACPPPEEERHGVESFGIRLLGEALRYAVCEAAPSDEIEQVCKDVCDLVPSVLTHVIKIELQRQAQETKSTAVSSNAGTHHRPSSASSGGHAGGAAAAGTSQGGQTHQAHGHQHPAKSRQSSTPGNEHSAATKGGGGGGGAHGTRVVLSRVVQK